MQAAAERTRTLNLDVLVDDSGESFVFDDFSLFGRGDDGRIMDLDRVMAAGGGGEA